MPGRSTPPDAYAADSIAAAFLKELGAPDTPAMRNAVKAWLRAESGNTVKAGNPWNISLPAAREIARSGGPSPTGSWTATSGQSFAQYADPATGARAAARLLTGAGSDYRHYDAIVTGARTEDPIGFLNALARSAWDAGRYGTKDGGTNRLIGLYTGSGGRATDSPGWIATLGKQPGDIFTASDVPKVVDWLQAHGVMSSGSIQSLAVADNLNTLVGLRIGSPEFQAKIGTQAAIAGQGGPIGKAATDAAGGAIATLGFGAFAVTHLLPFLALLGAVGLIGFGIVSMSRATARTATLPVG